MKATRVEFTKKLADGYSDEDGEITIYISGIMLSEGNDQVSEEDKVVVALDGCEVVIFSANKKPRDLRLERILGIVEVDDELAQFAIAMNKNHRKFKTYFEKLITSKGGGC